MKYTSLKTLKESCTAEALAGTVSDAVYVAKSNTNFKHYEAFNTSTVLHGGHQNYSKAYTMNVPVVESTYCRGMTKHNIIDISTEGALVPSEACLTRNVNETKMPGACVWFDFHYVENMTFPLTFKVQTEVEGVHNHTSAEVSITLNENIEYCEYVPEDQIANSTCGPQRCCGMGYTEGVNNQTNICSAEGQAPFGSPDTSVFTDFVCVHARPEPEGPRDGDRHNDTSDECGGCNAWHDDCCGMAYEVARSNTCHMSGMGCPPETE